MKYKTLNRFKKEGMPKSYKVQHTQTASNNFCNFEKIIKNKQQSKMALQQRHQKLDKELTDSKDSEQILEIYCNAKKIIDKIDTNHKRNFFSLDTLNIF